MYKTNIKNFFSSKMKSWIFSTLFLLLSIEFIFLMNQNSNFIFPFFSNQELFSIAIFLDNKSSLFSSLVSFITSMVFSYSIFYMSNQLNNRFIFLIFFFSTSMLTLILSGNLISMLIGWDGLGMTSFALVFFYQNEISVKSALITILINRLGDSALIIFLSTWIYLEKQWNMMFSISSKHNVLFFFILLAIFTKSAQFPFSSWLPAAMAAPTPISSLVHSSTLVAAGVFLCIRFNMFMYLNIYIISIASLMTMLLGGILAIKEPDFKKIIAFSTLSQLGMLMFVSSWGEEMISFFHLISHAIFKSFLFMLAGIFLHYNFGSQDSRILSANKNSLLFQILILFCLLNLSGFPISLGFLSKDLILETNLLFNSNFLFILFFLSCSITISYSFKMFSLISKFIKLSDPTKAEIKMMQSMIFIFFLFLLMSIFSLLLEEMNILDNLFSANMNSKYFDVLIIFASFLLKFPNKKFFESYIWTSFLIFLSSKLSNFSFLNFNLISFYFINSMITKSEFTLKEENFLSKMNIKFINWFIQFSFMMMFFIY